MSSQSNFLEHTNYFLVGIKGVAMTALAQCLLDLGKHVEGCDVEEDFVTKTLLDNKRILVKNGFHEDTLSEQTEVVVFTGAHKGSENPVVVEAKRRGLPVFAHADALAAIVKGKKEIVVCGVGGKSTTSAMITWVLEQSGKNPGFAVGVGNIPNLNITGSWKSKGELFVIEGDEYAIDPGHNNTARFLSYSPDTVVCTNLAYDHPDIYKDFQQVKDTYFTLFTKLSSVGALIVSSENTELLELAKQAVAKTSASLITYGNRPEDTISLKSYISQEGKTFSQVQLGEHLINLELHIPGKYNVYNALASLAVVQHYASDLDSALAALKEFKGTMRRFEFKGEKLGGVLCYDDYAHHPDEIRSVLKAAREWFPSRKIVVVFQPHTFSRTKSLFQEFSQVFTDAHSTYVLDIFASAREAFDPEITSSMLVEQIVKHGEQAEYVATLEDLVPKLKQELKPGDVLLTIGAGDLYALHDMLE